MKCDFEKTNFRMQCPGEYKQLPTQRLAVPVTRTLLQDLNVF